MSPVTDILIDSALVKQTGGSLLSWVFFGAASVASSGETSGFRETLQSVALILSIIVSTTTIISWTRVNLVSKKRSPEKGEG